MLRVAVFTSSSFIYNVHEIITFYDFPKTIDRYGLIKISPFLMM